MVKISELETDLSIGGAEQLVVNDGGTTKKTTVDAILARTHNHTASQITDFDTEVSNNTTVTTLVADLNTAEGTIATHTSDIGTLNTTKLGKTELRTGLTASKALVTNASGVEGYADPAVMASDAEALAGTIETKYINPKQAKDNYGALINVVTGTRNASGAQSIAHGLSRIPYMVLSFYSETSRSGHGFYGDGVQTSNWVANSGHGTSTTQLIYLGGAGNDCVVNSIDATNLNVTWTDNGDSTSYRLIFIA